MTTPAVGTGGAVSLCIELFCGLGGWSEGFMAEGFDCIGFDIERHVYPAQALPESTAKCPGADWNMGDSFNGTNEKRVREVPLTGAWEQYPGQLVLQDVRTLHGSQFRNADCIVASPPCQEYSYMSMPWRRGKQIAAALRGQGEFPEGYRGSRTIAQLNELFDACFRIQREACEAAGRHIPMVVENVKGAEPWVGRAKWHFGSFYLWGDVPALMPSVRHFKTVGHANMRDGHGHARHLTNQRESDALKVPGMNFHDHEKTGKPGRSFQSAAVCSTGAKVTGDWFGSYADMKASGTISPGRLFGKNSPSRKAASALIAKIPESLARHVARCYAPLEARP